MLSVYFLQEEEETDQGCRLPQFLSRRQFSRVSSLINLLPPVRTGSLKRIRQNLQCSISFRGVSRTEATPPSVRAETKRRDSKLWSETFDVQQGGETLSAREIRRQEGLLLYYYHITTTTILLILLFKYYYSYTTDTTI